MELRALPVQYSSVTCDPTHASGICSPAIWPPALSPVTAHLTPIRLRKPSEGRQALSGSPGSSSNWIYRTAAQGTNALRAWSSSVPSSLIASTVIPPALLSTNLASKPRPLPNRTAIRCPFHSLDKYPANTPPLSACDLLRASYPSDLLPRLCWCRQAPPSALQAGGGSERGWWRSLAALRWRQLPPQGISLLFSSSLRAPAASPGRSRQAPV